MRAMEVVEWMRSEQLLQLAIKYATRARKRQLANRLTDRAEQFVNEKEAAEAAESTESTQCSFSCYPVTSNAQPLEEDRYFLNNSFLKA